MNTRLPYVKLSWIPAIALLAVVNSSCQPAPPEVARQTVTRSQAAQEPAKSLHLSTFETYQSAWSIDVGPAERQRLLNSSVVEDCVYKDPGTEAHGYSELGAKISDANKRGPGASFRNDSYLEHHDQAIVNWTMFDGAGGEYAKGASYIRFGPDGRLTHMTGFFSPPQRAFQGRPQ